MTTPPARSPNRSTARPAAGGTTGRGPLGAFVTGGLRSRRARPRPDKNPRTIGPQTAKQERGARLVVALAHVTLFGTIILIALLAWGAPDWFTQPLLAALVMTNLPVGDNVALVPLAVGLAWALHRRKSVGWWAMFLAQLSGLVIGTIILVFYVIDDLTTDLVNIAWDFAVFDYAVAIGSIIFSLLLTPLLWRIRSAFPGRLRHASWNAVAITAFTGIAVTIAFATMVTVVLSEQKSRAGVHTLGVLSEAVGLSSSGLRDQIPPNLTWLPLVVTTCFIVTILLTLYVFLSSTELTNAWTADREVAVRKLLLEFGDDSLGYFNTRRDKSVVFGVSDRSAVSYTVVGSVSLASADPLGDQRYWPEAIAAWRAEARHYGWTLAVLGASEAGAKAYAAAGLKVIELGDEAVLNADHFSTKNTSRTAIRREVSRLKRDGHVVKVRRLGDLEPPAAAQVFELATRWRQGGSERGFSMALSRGLDSADGQIVVVTAHDPEGTVTGLLTFVPWGQHGLSLDLMRRSPQAPHGVTNLMVVELLEAAADLQVHRVSLNFCMFRSVFESGQKLAPLPTTRVAYAVLSVMDRFFQLESLYRFSMRFSPTWVPRYLCYDSNFSLASAAFAAARAEGFIPRGYVGTGSTQSLNALSREQLQDVAVFADQLKPSLADVVVKRSDQTKHRISCVTAAADEGVSLYPIGLPEATRLAELSEDVTGELTCYGRVRWIRHHGGVLFVDLCDGPARRQVVLERDTLGKNDFRQVTQWLSVGDVLVIRGSMGPSRSGTPSILATHWQVAAKSLHPVPFGGLTDPARRLRERSMDLVVNYDGAALLRKRSAAVAAIRQVLAGSGLMEVETPMLNAVHGGASARPFRTHINAYSTDLTLRIAPELYLKRLVVAGMGGVFEIGRNFRNEGVDATHNPEFTAVEAYQPFADYHTMRLLTQQLIQQAARAVHGAEVAMLPPAPGEPAVLTDISGDWPTVSVLDAVSEAVGKPISLATEFDELLGLCRKHEVAVRDEMGPGAVIEELYAELVEPLTTKPTFYMDFPVETSPLAGPHRSVPGLAERWDLVAAGTEIGTAYSELTDPLVQRDRLTEQSLKAAAGDLEAMAVDEDFLTALELGMPPCGGLGIGVDRLVMLLTDTPIRSVLTFPFVKPERAQTVR